MNGWFAAANVGFVHHIVVQKGEIMIHFQSHGRQNGFLDVTTNCVTSHKHKHRAYALASERHSVGNRFIQVCRICRIRQTLDGCVHTLKIFVEC